MTLYHFALFPKRCDKCGRTFVWERCDYFYREVGIEHYDLKCWRCSRCMKRYDNQHQLPHNGEKG